MLYEVITAVVERDGEVRIGGVAEGIEGVGVGTTGHLGLPRLQKVEGEVAVFDATNTTRARRHMIAHRCEQAGVDLTFSYNFV